MSINLSNKKGFALVEILTIVFIVISIIGVSSAFFINIRPDIQLRGATRELIADIRHIQQKTVTDQIDYCLQIVLEDNKYYLFQCESKEIFKEVFLSNEIIEINLSGFTENTIRFNPYGAVRESGSIILKNSREKENTIELRPSGFVRFYN